MDAESTAQSTDTPKEDIATDVAEAAETPDRTVSETETATTEGETAMVAEAAAEPEDDFYNKIEPKGAYTFVILVGLFMTGYWFVTYFEVFVLRGG